MHRNNFLGYVLAHCQHRAHEHPDFRKRCSWLNHGLHEYVQQNIAREERAAA